tara:strand:+ start:78 stop:482 length:405 start_codon:yes stop_codon:yes gene_type:complete
MIYSLNYFINLLNLFFIFIYFVFINIGQIKIELEYFLVLLIIINLLLKLYNWYHLKIVMKKRFNLFINNILLNEKFTQLSILIFSIIIPIYMIFQKDSLVIDLFIEKLSFLFVFIFAVLGFYLEFFFLDNKSNK